MSAQASNLGHWPTHAAPPSAPASKPTGPMETRGLKDGYASADNEPRDPERDAYLDYRGDDKGQGLDAYWKWGHAAGWNDHKKHAATSAPAEPLSDGRLWSFVRSVMSQGACIYQDYASGHYKTYEAYSAHLDAAASNRAAEFQAAVHAKQGGAS